MKPLFRLIASLALASQLYAADLTLSANMDTLLQAANFAAARTSLGVTTADSGVFTTQFDLEATGVRFTASNGSLTLLGLGNGADESIKLDFNTTTNTLLVTSASGVTLIDMGSIGLTVGDITGGALTVTSITNNLSVFAATTSAQLAGVISNETGSGALVFGTSPDFTTGITVGGVAVPTISSTSTLTNKTLTSPTLTTPSAFTTGGVITLAENTSIALDPAGSADGKYSGVTVTGTAGAALAFGDLIYLDPTDSRWELADANSAAAADGDSRGLIGICVLAAGADGNATTILLQGIVRADAAFPALTIGAPVYVSETAGDIVVAQPTTTDAVIRIMGYAMTADEIYFAPAGSWTTHN